MRLTRPKNLLELLAPREKRINYIEPNFVPLSSKVLIGGLAKCGKSFTSMEIARALSTGTPVFGKFPVPKPAKVYLLDKELGEYSMAERAATFYQGLSADQLAAVSDNFVSVSGDPAFKFDVEECQEPIIQRLDEVQPNVMIIDPVSKFMDGSDSDNDHVKRFLEFIDVLIERYAKTTQLSVIMTHHFKKPAHDWQGNEVEPLSAYNFRGGSKWYDDMDSLVTMRRHDVTDKHWKLECEPEFRHGRSPDAFWLDVQPEGNPVVCEHVKPSIEAGGGGLRDRAPAKIYGHGLV